MLSAIFLAAAYIVAAVFFTVIHFLNRSTIMKKSKAGGERPPE
jgi:hypothetical protein